MFELLKRTKKSHESSATFFEYALVVYIIFVSGSLYYSTYFKNLLLLPLAIILISYLFLVRRSTKVRLKKKQIAYIFFFSLFAAANISSTALTSYLVLIFRLFLSVLVIQFLDIRNFSKKYIDVMLLLSLASLLSIPISFARIRSPLSPLFSLGGQSHPYDNFLLFAINYNHPFDLFASNIGLFWEQGAFQFFISLAIGFAIIFDNLNPFNTLIFAVTLFTTRSTAGYISLMLLLFFLFSSLVSKRKKILASACLILISILLSTTFWFLDLTENSVVASLKDVVVNKFTPEHKDFRSFLARYEDTLIDLELFAQYPLTGSGYGNVEVKTTYSHIYSNYNANTNSLSALIAQLGVIGFYLMTPIIRPKFACQHDKIKINIYSLLLFVALLTQYFLSYFIFTLLALYGLQGRPQPDLIQK